MSKESWSSHSTAKGSTSRASVNCAPRPAFEYDFHEGSRLARNRLRPLRLRHPHRRRHRLSAPPRPARLHRRSDRRLRLAALCSPRRLQGRTRQVRKDCDDAHGSLHFQAALTAKTINAGPELPLLRPPWTVANVLTLGKKMPRDLPPTVNIFFRQALTAKSSTGEQARCIALLLL